VCTPTCQYFPHITTLYLTSPNLSVHTRAPIFFVHYHYVLRNAKFKCTPMRQYFSCITTLHRATPNFSTCSHTPLFSTHHKIFTAHHAFLVRTPAHIHFFYAHQLLVNSAAEIGAFAKPFTNFHHRHSATIKFVQFHPDNTNSTSTTTNRCWLTFMERIFPKLNS
jgi:hypothetical protein